MLQVMHQSWQSYANCDVSSCGKPWPCLLHLMKTIPLCYIDILLYKNRHKTQLVT
jgi:hypothetical protein